ncbi:MAG: hypothetical protein V4469_04490 [Patescibacteria group bacterium]
MDEKKLVPLKKSVEVAVVKANKLVIKNENDMIVATTLLSEINRYSDDMKAKKKTITDPANLVLKNAKILFKPLEENLEKGIEAIRSAMSEYQTEKVRLAEIEEKKISARVGEGKGKIKMETAIKQIEEVERPTDSIQTASGGVTFRPTKKFEVMDVSLLPVAYVEANETAIREAMKNGIELPGVRYYVEQVPVNSR